ncbi:MAG: UDP-N-acetylglucosamine 1-carboxyvinyltransferase, partial [Treponema socranskii subsp. buccale]
MDKLLVYGGYPINGSVIISGAKNAALPILFATILTNETVVLHNVPRLHDVETTIRLLENLGAKIVWTAENSLTIDASRINNFEASYDLVK